MKFFKRNHIESSEVLNLKVSIRQQACPHCSKHGNLISHGYAYGYRPEGGGQETRRIRFFCSDRFAKSGCGKTFSLLWCDRLVNSSACLKQLIVFLTAFATGSTVHKAWYKSKANFSISTAYRWVKRFLRSISHIRSQLPATSLKLSARGSPSSGTPALKTLAHLASTFKEGCCLSSFQLHFQSPFFCHL